MDVLASWAELPKRPSADQLSAGLGACGSQASAVGSDVGSDVLSSGGTAEFLSPLCVLSESAVLRHEQCASPWCSPPASAAEPPSACLGSRLTELKEQFADRPGYATWADGADQSLWQTPPSSGNRLAVLPTPATQSSGDTPTTQPGLPHAKLAVDEVTPHLSMVSPGPIECGVVAASAWELPDFGSMLACSSGSASDKLASIIRMLAQPGTCLLASWTLPLFRVSPITTRPAQSLLGS